MEPKHGVVHTDNEEELYAELDLVEITHSVTETVGSNFLCILAVLKLKDRSLESFIKEISVAEINM